MLAIHAATKTMSSREIAELVNSRHDDVKRSIDRLAQNGVIVQPPTADEHSEDTMGRTRITVVYLLDKRSSLIVVAQLCPEFTARIVDRWQELEAQQAANLPAIPQTFAQALMLAAQQAQEIEAKDEPSIASLRWQIARPSTRSVPSVVPAPEAPPTAPCQCLKASPRSWHLLKHEADLLALVVLVIALLALKGVFA